MSHIPDFLVDLDHARELARSGLLAEARGVLTALLDLTKWCDEPQIESRIEIVAELADVMTRQGEPQAAVQAVDEALQQLRPGTSETTRRLWLKLNARKAWALFRRGKLDAARDAAMFLKSVAAATNSNDHESVAIIYNTLGGIRWNQGDLVSAIRFTEAARLLYQSSGNQFGVATAHTNLGVLHFTRGDWKDAAEHLELAEGLRRELGWVRGRPATLLNLGLLHMAAGDHTEARQVLQESLAISRESGEALDVVHAEIAIAHLAVIESRFDEAAALLDRMLATDITLSEDDFVQALCLRALIEAQDAIDRGLKTADRARQIAEQSGIRDSFADSCRVLGTLQARAARFDEAETSIRQSIQAAEEIADPYRRALALLELGILIDARSRSAGDESKSWVPTASAPLQQAREVFEKLGAKHDLRRVQARRIA